VVEQGQGEPHAANANTWKYWQSAAKQDAKRCGTERLDQTKKA
jgi:hypothetical protein